VDVEIVRPGTYEALIDHLETAKAKYGAGHYQIVHFDVHGALLTYEELQKGAQADHHLYQARYGRSKLEEFQGIKAFLFLEGDKPDQADPVEAGELADLLIAHQVPVVVLNACQSGKQVKEALGKQVEVSETSLGSRLMQAGVQVVVAMGYSVTVTAAQLMMRTLYEELFEGRPLSGALCRARRELYNRKGRRAYFNQTIDLEDWVLPVVYQN
jgi:CHAT domain-containing protein